MNIVVTPDGEPSFLGAVDVAMDNYIAQLWYK